ncbi:hypothetical protein ACFPN2_21500 [Steroidobacter flavus]|uniref:Uncharacterized protein n=1 Tax=Steroidobacter flavus TaxID=1842136 RepID=A0ABV8SVY7_9GAMM
MSKLDATSDATIERGERLCEVYETWRRLAPSSHTKFERFTLLGEGITRNDRIFFRHCGSCHAIILIDRLGRQRRVCDHCARARREQARKSPHTGKRRKHEETDLVLYRLQLLGGQFVRERTGVHPLGSDSFFIV